jgi:hypothetical protein
MLGMGCYLAEAEFALKQKVVCCAIFGRPGATHEHLGCLSAVTLMQSSNG